MQEPSSSRVKQHGWSTPKNASDNCTAHTPSIQLKHKRITAICLFGVNHYRQTHLQRIEIQTFSSFVPLSLRG
ncbi:MAG: hypothetical protein ACKVH8_06475 [Pirellulales bacterium]